MTIEIGHVEAIFRYPVKSMAGERVEVANMGWHGIDGDRRLALRRTEERNDFPWLTAGKLPDLLLFTPLRHEDGVQGDLPTHVRTPEGKEMAVFGEELAAEIERRHRAPVQMMHLRDGIFDEASVSVIAAETVREIGRLTGRAPDVRRFRPNIVIRLLRPNPFEEDKWVGGVLLFGEPGEGPRVSVTMRDVRCSMVNFDPDSGRSAPEVLKSIVRTHQNTAGIYGTVIRTGRLATGQTIRLQDRDRIDPVLEQPGHQPVQIRAERRDGADDGDAQSGAGRRRSRHCQYPDRRREERRRAYARSESGWA